MNNKLFHILSLIFIALLFVKCEEPYDPETETFEDALVIEAKLTNNHSKQKVKLTRTSRLEIDTLLVERDAQVWIEDQNNVTYQFSESEPGVYLSNDIISAEFGIGYTLHITTAAGKKYTSREEYLTPESDINDLYTQDETINGVRGVQVYASSSEIMGEEKYFLYEFDETYKIVTPYQINLEMLISNYWVQYSRWGSVINYSSSFSELALPKPQICYTTQSQKAIIQANIENYSTNKIDNLPIRFIPHNSYLIRDRYSILVKQYVQSYDSYNYYKTLKDIGSYEGLLEENQTGYVTGNIFSEENINDKVIGFFDVMSMSSKRIYFNYETYDYSIPPYIYPVTLEVLDYRDTQVNDGDQDERQAMYDKIEIVDPPWEVLSYELVYDGRYDVPVVELINPECGNCTTFSSNIKPEFWED